MDTLTDQLKLMRYRRRATLTTDLSGVGQGKGTNMAFIYLEEPVQVSSPSAVTQKDTYIWATAVSVVCVLLIVVVLGITIVGVKIKRLKAHRLTRQKQSEAKSAGPEATPMPVNDETGVDEPGMSEAGVDEEAVIRLDATVSNSEI